MNVRCSYGRCSKSRVTEDEQSKTDAVPVPMNPQSRGAPMLSSLLYGKEIKVHLSNFPTELISGGPVRPRVLTTAHCTCPDLGGDNPTAFCNEFHLSICIWVYVTGFKRGAEFF